jgi:hypothetical protein
MNNAMQYAQSELEVGWTVVFHPAQRVDHVLSATEEYPHSPPNSEHPALSGDALAFDVTGKGFTGIRSVTLRLEDQAGTNEGSYWRRIGFELVGSEDGAPSGYAMASNSSLLEEIAVRASVEADVSWFPLEAECSLVQTTLISDTHPVGEASFP